MGTIEEGSLAPKFSLPDKEGKIWCLGSEQTAYTVVYFYPRDNTPGCTIEAVEFTGLLDEFGKRDALVVGISGGDAASKQKFCQKHKLQILLLSDSDMSVSGKYGVYGDKKFMGMTVPGIQRTTFVLDAQLKVIKVFNSVRAKGHAQDVLKFIDQQSS